MCYTIDSGEKGYKLPEQILFNFLALFPSLGHFQVQQVIHIPSYFTTEIDIYQSYMHSSEISVTAT